MCAILPCSGARKGSTNKTHDVRWSKVANDAPPASRLLGGDLPARCLTCQVVVGIAVAQRAIVNGSRVVVARLRVATGC